jgi:hypothetical protein
VYGRMIARAGRVLVIADTVKASGPILGLVTKHDPKEV